MHNRNCLNTRIGETWQTFLRNIKCKINLFLTFLKLKMEGKKKHDLNNFNKSQLSVYFKIKFNRWIIHQFYFRNSPTTTFPPIFLFWYGYGYGMDTLNIIYFRLSLFGNYTISFNHILFLCRKWDKKMLIPPFSLLKLSCGRHEFIIIIFLVEVLVPWKNSYFRH